MSDRLVAVSDSIPRSVNYPILIGALRSSDDPNFTWMIEAGEALSRDQRVVLTGDVFNSPEVNRSVSELKGQFPGARFALFMHWSQAVGEMRSVGILLHVEDIFVAVDECLDEETVRQIDRSWHPQWVLLPTLGTKRSQNWPAWVSTTLFPGKHGKLFVLAADCFDSRYEKRFISADELRITVSELSIEHPLIEVCPVPAPWFQPSEIGPWNLQNRRLEISALVFDSRHVAPALKTTVAVIVPFVWQGRVDSLGELNRRLLSIEKTFTDDLSREIIIAIDRRFSVPLFDVASLRTGLKNYAIVDVPRFSDENDWRIGFIKNAGAAFALTTDAANSTFLFVDSDAEISDFVTVRSALVKGEFDVLHTENFKLMAVRPSIFKTVGGFADAFSSYGCEDKMFVWSARVADAHVAALPNSTISIDRTPKDAADARGDDLFTRTSRLRKSANLMYRMTLDPRVHAEFYVGLGRHMYIRAFLKAIADNAVLRFFGAPFFFVLTLAETDARFAYLNRIYGAVLWKLKRPILWMHSTPSQINSRQLRDVKESCRQFLIRASHVFKSGHGRAIASYRIRAAKLRREKFGWLRLKTAIIKMYAKMKRISVTKIAVPVWSVASRYAWRVPVALEKLLSAFTKYRSMLHAATISRLRAQSWIFNEPTAWFSLNTPLFYRFVWKPLFKLRYFLEYHLSSRWRKS